MELRSVGGSARLSVCVFMAVQGPSIFIVRSCRLVGLEEPGESNPSDPAAWAKWRRRLPEEIGETGGGYGPDPCVS